MKCLLSAICALFVTSANATPVTQTFENHFNSNSFNITWEGVPQAASWDYTKYEVWNPNLGMLTAADLSTSISGTRESTADPVYVRIAFASDGGGYYYQFYREYVISGTGDSFSDAKNWHFDLADGLNSWFNYIDPATARYYIETRTAGGLHKSDLYSTLTFTYSANIPEPSVLALTLLAMFVLALTQLKGFRDSRHISFTPPK